MHLPNRATNLLDLLSLSGLGRRPICFVAHSLGGLVVAQMLRNATTFSRRYGHVGDAVQGLVFLATPFQGSVWANVCEGLTYIFHPSKALEDLKKHHPFVSDLGRWFREYLDTRRHIECRFYCEAQRTYGVITVVNELAADPGLPHMPLVPLDEDHTSIAKPQERASHVYGGVCSVLRSLQDRSRRDKAAGRAGHRDLEVVAAVRRVAEGARPALEPHVLPRIARRPLQASIFSPIADGLREPKPRIVAVVGPAGIGKTVILGQVYDSLKEVGAAWVVVIRCSDVQSVLDEPDSLPLAFGLVASGIKRSVVDLAHELRDGHGRGAVLIDTLDAILTTSLVPRLRNVFEGLAAAQTTVVFSCREHEYELLEPLQESFFGLSRQMHRRGVPMFAYPEEVREAALGFVKDSPDIDERAGGVFVDGMLGLAADNVRLQEITQSPLLLALLCSLFGREGFVPPDLTVSRLWERYWHDKVARSRLTGVPSPLGRKKERLCIELARSLFALSERTLCLSMYEHDVDLPTDDSITNEAWTELLSEGVIKREAPAGRVRFFHQTLLEYAIARYLTSKEGRTDLAELFRQAGGATDGATGAHVWPVVRQVLAIADYADCSGLLEKLDRRALPAFRAAALAVTSREEPALLQYVRDWALKQGGAFQKEWLRALEGVSGSLAEAAFDGALLVLARGEKGNATAATEAAAGLIVRFGDRLPEHRVADVIEAIRQASPSADRNHSLMGKLLAVFTEAPKPRDHHELSTLRACYASLPAAARNRVIGLHLAAGVDGADQAELLRLAMGFPLGGDDERKDAVALVTLTCSAEDILARLAADDLQRTWVGTFAAAAGRAAARDDAVLEALAARLCAADSAVWTKASRALVQAVGEGAGARICDRILATPPGSLVGAPQKMASIANVLIELAPVLPERSATALAKHVYEAGEASGGFEPRMIAALLLLDGAAAEPSPERWHLVAGLPVPQRVDCLTRYMRAAPESFVRARADDLEALLLDGGVAEARGIRRYVELCQVRARESEAALDRLVALASGERKTGANAAAAALVRLIEEGRTLHAERLLPMARARFDGVRQNWSRALLAIVDGGQPLAEGELVAALQAVDADDINHSIRHNVFELVRRWALRQKKVSPDVVAALGRLTARTIATRAPTTGLIAALKAVAWEPGADLLPLIRAQVLQVALGANLEYAHNAEHEFADVLTAVARHDRSVFAELAPHLSEMAPCNVQSLVMAIRRVEGKHSPMLTEILSHNSCPTKARSMILDFYGA